MGWSKLMLIGRHPTENNIQGDVTLTRSGRDWICGAVFSWRWRAVDQDGYVLDEFVQTRRNTKAARRLLTRLLKKQGIAPKRMIPDKLPSYGAARRQVMRLLSTGRIRG